MTRIDQKFAALRAEGRKAFVAYVMAGDPDSDTSLALMKGLPAAGVDIIELGMPFTDPMADGPTIQLAGQRALEAGQTLQGRSTWWRRSAGATRHPHRADGLLQPDLFARRGALSDRCEGRRDRRADRRRPAARGG